MNTAVAVDLPRLPPPIAGGSGRDVPSVPADRLRAHVWLEARNFFTRDSAQQFCWLWLLAGDGRVHALRVLATRVGDDHFTRSLLARFAAEPDLPILAARAFGPALPLPAAPIVPLPRWHVSWGHPLQQALRAFAFRLDQGVLAALGLLEVPGSFFGSVSNYNRLALLPETIRNHRLQALAEFPVLVAPLLLDVYGRPDMFGTDEDEPAQAAECDRGAGQPVLDAMDRGRDLVGALAEHYGIGRALVRSPMMREPWTRGCVPRDVLRLLDAMPAHARPQSRADVEDRLPQLRALPLRLRGPIETEHLARTFAKGWNKTWQSLDDRVQGSPAPHLRDTRDFLRAALEQPDVPDMPVDLDMERLCLAWLVRRGLASLLDASLRWHAQPLVTSPLTDGLPDTLISIWDQARFPGGYNRNDWGRASEVLTRQDLIDEGKAMHHGVGDYWRCCVTEGVRIVHVEMTDGERVTAQYRLDDSAGNPVMRLEELRGPCNAQPSEAAEGVAKMIAGVLNDDAFRDRRAEALLAARTANILRQPGCHAATRPLDRRSRQELRMVLEWCVRQPGWRTAATVLLRAAIRGFDHAQGPQVFPQLAPGDALQLVREPTHPYDARAVRIDWRGHKLGYVPREDNDDIARRLDAGEALVATISTVAQQAGSWDAVEFEITQA
jgi:hypothetical protein